MQVMQATQLTRDPFKRRTLMRIKCLPNQECMECGQPARWQYGWDEDGLRYRKVVYSSPFCSIGCWRTYTE